MTDLVRKILVEEMKTRDLDSDEIRYLMDTKDRTGMKTEKMSYTQPHRSTKQTKPEPQVINNLRNSNGKTTWEIMKEVADPEELKELKRIEQKALKKTIYPKEATPQQMATLKKKIDRYKYEHGEQKPFIKQDKKKISAASKEYAETVSKVITNAMASNFGTPPLATNKKEPEKSLEQIIQERSDKKLKLEQEAYDKQFGTQGIVRLKRPI